MGLIVGDVSTESSGLMIFFDYCKLYSTDKLVIIGSEIFKNCLTLIEAHSEGQSPQPATGGPNLKVQFPPLLPPLTIWLVYLNVVRTLYINCRYLYLYEIPNYFKLFKNVFTSQRSLFAGKKTRKCILLHNL